ncbi:MAG: lactate racemase domain-containing protein [Pseudomonadota bacterium]
MDFPIDLVADVALPAMVPVRQHFDATRIEDVAGEVARLLAEAPMAGLLPGQSVALGVGSRGMAALPTLVALTVAELKRRGAAPFIVPAMGSHGGATATGQTAILAGLGVSEESAGCPIRSDMDVVELGRLPNGLPVLIDRLAMGADHIAFINRVKPHTSYSGSHESGLAKMLAIGLANHKGAESCHAQGFGKMAQNVVAMAKVKLEAAPILFGLATVENAYDAVRHVEVVAAADMIAREPALLAMARDNMPKILFNPLDVLIVERMGKEYSGTGIDPHVTGRAGTPFVKPALAATKVVVLDLSLKSGGNATGLGLADFCTKALFDKIDFRAFYANHLTSTVTTGAKIPMICADEATALKAAIKTCNAADPARPRVVRIANTLHVGEIMVSEALVDEARARDDTSLLGVAAGEGGSAPRGGA